LDAKIFAKVEPLYYNNICNIIILPEPGVATAAAAAVPTLAAMGRLGGGTLGIEQSRLSGTANDSGFEAGQLTFM